MRPFTIACIGQRCTCKQNTDLFHLFFKCWAKKLCLLLVLTHKKVSFCIGITEGPKGHKLYAVEHKIVGLVCVDTTIKVKSCSV